MVAVALKDLVRTSVRVTSTLTDDEIEMLIAAAVAEMRRVGVREELLAEESMGALAKFAVVSYVKANYGYDNEEADRFMASFHQTCVDLMNSTANVCADQGASGGSDGYMSEGDVDELVDGTSDGTGEGEGGSCGTCPCIPGLMSEADVDALVDGG